MEKSTTEQIIIALNVTLKEAGDLSYEVLAAALELLADKPSEFIKNWDEGTTVEKVEFAFGYALHEWDL